jgi:hypothetical protein
MNARAAGTRSSVVDHRRRRFDGSTKRARVERRERRGLTSSVDVERDDDAMDDSVPRITHRT